MKSTAEIGLAPKESRRPQTAVKPEEIQEQSRRRLEILRGTLEKVKSRATGEKDHQDRKTIINQSYGEVKLSFREADPNNPTADIDHNTRVANKELQREVFRRNKPLYEARQSYIYPPRFNSARIGKIGVNPGEVFGKMRDKLDLYIRLAKADPDYQRVLTAFRNTLPETFYVYRGQIGNAPPRRFENYSISPEEATIYAMDWGSQDEQYKPGANVVKDLVGRDQVLALGMGGRGRELIIDTQTTREAESGTARPEEADQDLPKSMREKVSEIIRRLPQRTIVFHGTPKTNLESIGAEGLTRDNSSYFIFNPESYKQNPQEMVRRFHRALKHALNKGSHAGVKTIVNTASWQELLPNTPSLIVALPQSERKGFHEGGSWTLDQGRVTHEGPIPPQDMMQEPIQLTDEDIPRLNSTLLTGRNLEWVRNQALSNGQDPQEATARFQSGPFEYLHRSYQGSHQIASAIYRAMVSKVLTYLETMANQQAGKPQATRLAA